MLAMAQPRPTAPSSPRTLLALGACLWLGLLTPPTPVAGLWTCGTCEGGSSLSCPDSMNLQFSVSLKPFLDELNRSLLLTCDYFTKNLNLTMLQGCSFPNVIHVKIEQCPLFEESIGSVLTKIGVTSENVNSLLWLTSHSVENQLQSWHLDKLPNLTYLQIQDNEFQSLPSEFLKNTPLLRKLFITSNTIPELPSDLLSYTPDLTLLELGNNRIQSLSATLLDNLPSLIKLNLWSNALTSLPATLFKNNANLTSVLLRSNQLTEVPEALFKNLNNLHTVDISINKLSTLAESSFEGCSKLKDMFLAYNSISYLPPNIFRGTALQVVSLGYNGLSNITGVFNNIPTLQNITLHYNVFETLPTRMFFNSPNIVKIDLQSNLIKTLPMGIFQTLSKLKIILLNNNSLEELPSGLFRNCISLSGVYLQRNNLTSLPIDTFPDHSSTDIEKLYLSNNQLTLSETYFSPLNPLTRIRELYLANNKITSVLTDALQVFTMLNILDLRNNLITSLTDRELMFISKNVTLLLQDNQIRQIVSSNILDTVSNDEKILSVRLAGNPLNCDCQMHSFLRIAQLTPPFELEPKYNLIVEDAINTSCASPSNNAGQLLAHVDRTKVVCEAPCSNECSCNVRPYDNFLLIDCSGLGLSDPPSYTDKFHEYELAKKFNLSLDLSGNEFDDVSFLNSSVYGRLINLNLANNSLAEVNASYLPESLMYIDFRFNNFTAMSQPLVDHLNSSGLTLQLGNNPWSCDCGLKSFHEFLRNNYKLVVDHKQVVCSDGGAPVEELTPEQMCSFLYQPATLASIVAGSVLLLLVTVLVTAAWYRHKEMIKVWLYSHNMCLWAVTEHEIDADKQYDAFISYSYKDEGFVNNILVPGLESGDPKYRVCLHYRDWVPGEYIQDQILSSVRASRRTIVVLSKNFIESVWGQLEFKTAHSQALQDKTNRIIIVVYGDVPGQEELDGALKLYVSLNTYLKWGDQHFWERLRYAMPHAKYARYKKSQVDKLEMVKPAPKSATKTLED